MSWNPALTPGCPETIGVDAVETLMIPRAYDPGGFVSGRTALVARPSPGGQLL
ncbi:hypothetical protein QWY84_18310 [Aquisalimonas lutea]|uniref:hypothetical protein n=1 Tax=Aquisalimonas lutea TaxID=1327750 RepID=UPI0025B5F831|nr:hypothetical protein [Aquisalimonas lutea]MDN3519566.1 hypothetical protein [Aquisalimonas lutea]